MFYFTAVLGEIVAPGTLPKTFERSTPVKAFTAGGIWPTSRVMSDVVLSGPPISTISSVLARGAATSAAIWNKKIIKGKLVTAVWNI